MPKQHKIKKPAVPTKLTNIGHQLDSDLSRLQGLPPAAQSQQLELQEVSEPMSAPHPSPVSGHKGAKLQSNKTAVAGVGKQESKSTPSNPYPVGRGLWAARSELQQMMVTGVVQGVQGVGEERTVPERRMRRRTVEMIFVMSFIASGFFIQCVCYSYLTPAYVSASRDFWNELMTVSFTVQVSFLFTSFTTRHLAWVMLPPWVMVVTVEMVNIYITASAGAVGEHAYRMNAEAGLQSLSALGLLGSFVWLIWLAVGCGKGTSLVLKPSLGIFGILVLNFRSGSILPSQVVLRCLLITARTHLK